MADVVDFAHPLPNLHREFLAEPSSMAKDRNSTPSHRDVIRSRILHTPVEPEGLVRSQTGGYPLPNRNNLASRRTPSSSCPSRTSAAESFEQSTDFLVREFLAYRLQISDCGDVSGLLRPFPPQSPLSRHPHADRGSNRTPPTGNRVRKVSETLQILGDHLDTTYWQAFQQTIPADWLEMKNTVDIKNKFFTLSRDLYFDVDSNMDVPALQYKEKINWSRIITLFCFTSQLACVAASSNHQEIIPELALWLTQFISRYLRSWIERNGGWEGVISYEESLTLPKHWRTSSGCAYGFGALATIGLGLTCMVLLRKVFSSRL